MPRKKGVNHGTQPTAAAGRAPRALKAEAVAVSDGLAHTADERAKLSAADRENPKRLAGQALKDLAHQWGIARSESAVMSDEKLRQQLNIIAHRRYEG
jgi:hypothetical protein